MLMGATYAELARVYVLSTASNYCNCYIVRSLAAGWKAGGEAELSLAGHFVCFSIGGRGPGDGNVAAFCAQHNDATYT